MGSANDLVGQLVGPWRLEACVGEGGLAAVYRATHSRVGSRAAIKVLHGEHAGVADWAERMLVEAQLVNKIGSPHIVKIVDLLKTADERPALVMELLEGAPLSSVMSLPPIGSLLVVMLDVLDALALAHQHEIVHRDIKPSNIFVSPDGRGTLLDFGIAKLLAVGQSVIKTQAGAALGTPRYMAPEQLLGDPIGPATDLYAIGEVLFEELTGEGAFGEVHGDALVQHKLSSPARALSAVRSDVPSALAAIVDRALSRDARARWTSARAMSEALRGVLTDLPEAAFDAIAMPTEVASPHDSDTAPLATTEPDLATSNGKKPVLGNVGPYRLEAILGEGGAGKVYRAYDPRLRRHVALKVFHTSTDAGAERFLAEARAHARLNHPNVCRIFDMGDASGVPYLAMQLLSGRTLGEAASKLDIKQRVGLIVECGRALQAVHSLGLVHRDVKPANILVELDDEGAPHAYLTDFGLVRSVGEAGLTTSGTIVGTPRYMAPEQLSGNPNAIDARTDVYALGATLYEILTGRPAFDGATSVELMFQISTQEPIELRRLVPTLPRDLETIALKCLNKEPQRRYASTGELVDDLEHWLRDEPIGARPPALTERLRRVAKRHRVLVASAAVAAVIGTSATTFELVRWQRDQREAAIVDTISRDAAMAREKLRSAYLLPLHDLAPERAVAENVLARIAALNVSARPSFRARLLLEAGTLEIDIGEPKRAKQTLEQAIHLAPNDPETQRRHGEVSLQLYVHSLSELSSHDDLVRINKMRAELAATTRDSATIARNHNRDDRVGGYDQDQLLDGAIQSAEGRHDEALATAHALIGERPLSAEALFLEAEAYAARGDDATLLNVPDKIDQDYQHAITSYKKGLAIARSHPIGWMDYCGVLNAVYSRAALSGHDPRGQLDEVRRVCQNAIMLNPTMRSPLAYWVSTLSYTADYEQDHSVDMTPRLVEAEAVYVKSGELGPTSPAMIQSLIGLNMAAADQEMVRGGDASRYIDRGLDLAARAELIHFETAEIQEARANFYGRRAAIELRHGQSPLANLDRAIKASQRAIELDPLSLTAYGIIGTSAQLSADDDVANGRSPIAALDQGVTAATTLLAVHPDYPLGYERMGELFTFYMKLRVLADADPSPLLHATLAWDRCALDRKPDLVMMMLGQGEAYRLVAEYRLRHGLPVALGDMATARELARRGLEIEPALTIAWGMRARIEIMSAQAEPKKFDEYAAAAAASIAQGLHNDPNDPDVLEYAAGVALVRARHASATDARQQFLTQGLAFAQRSLDERPQFARVQALHASMLAELAKTTNTTLATKFAADSDAEFAAAFAKVPSLKLEYARLPTVAKN